MKKYIILLLFNSVVMLSVKSQNIHELMEGYDNKFALEHIELFTKSKNQKRGHFPFIFHESIKIVNVDPTWLDNMVYIIEGNPTIMYSYLDNSNTQNLAAYILLSSILDIDMADDSIEEVSIFSYFKSFVTEESIEEYAERTTIPMGQDPFEHMINAEWGEIANGANRRLKIAVSNWNN